MVPPPWLNGSIVWIMVESEGATDEDFPEELRRIVSENARPLTFESLEFES
jgi:hypothetical protein